MSLEELFAVIGAFIGIAGFIFGFASYRRGSKSDTKQEASQMTTVIVKLESISNGIAEIKSELHSTKDEVKEIRERLIITEQSIKSAWHRIDEMTV